MTDPYEIEYDKDKGPPKIMTVSTSMKKRFSNEPYGASPSPTKSVRSGLQTTMNPALLLKHKQFTMQE